MPYFVISDIRGNIEALNSVLKHRQPEDTLVFLGNYIDGEDSLGVVRRLIELKNEEPEKVVVLRGSREQFLLNFLESPFFTYLPYAMTGGFSTLKEVLPPYMQKTNSWVTMPFVYKHLFKKKYRAIIEFIQDMPFHHETSNILFTPAGFDPQQKMWQSTPKYQFLWIKKHYRYPNKTGKLNVFGNTPTSNIHKSISLDIWLNEEKTYLAINGDIINRGKLHAVRLSDGGNLLETFTIEHPHSDEDLYSKSRKIVK